MSISRAITVLCILPVVIALYQWISKPKKTATSEVDERTALLTDNTPETPASREGSPDEATTREVSAKQELVIARVGLLLDAVGMLMTWRSGSTFEVALCQHFPSSPANSSLTDDLR